MNFQEAKEFCRDKGAHMVLVESEKEQQELTNMFANFTTRKERFWVGAMNIDGALLNTHDWKNVPFRPWGGQSRTGDCVRTGPDFSWYKTRCTSKGESGGYTWNPLCKKQKVTKPSHLRG